MSKTSFGYRGRILFTVGTLGTIIFEVLTLVFCITWLGIAIFCLFMDEFFISIIGFVVGGGGSPLILLSIIDEIRAYHEERCLKKINSNKYTLGEMVTKSLRQDGEDILCKKERPLWDLMQELRKGREKKWYNREADLAKYAYKIYNEKR